jgi:hypothetical protein
MPRNKKREQDNENNVEELDLSSMPIETMGEEVEKEEDEDIFSFA